MKTKANIGARITLDGEREYREAVSGVNKSMRDLKSELKAVSVEYEGNANSLDALKAKNSNLTKQQEEQEKKLKLLRGALEDVTKEYGENSEKARDWQSKLNNAYAELNRINKSLDSNEKYMKEAERSTDKTAKSIDEFGKEVKTAKKETSTFGEVLKANLTGEAIIQGLSGIVNGIQNIITSTEEYRKDFSKLETNAQSAGVAIEEVEQQLKSLDAITGETDSNIEALSNLLQTGFKGNSLVEVVDALSGAVVKFPDTLKIESLSDSLQETLATSKATGQFGELLERLGYNIDNFNTGLSTTTTEAEKQQYALSVLASTGLAQVNEEYERNNKDIIEYSNAQFEMRKVMSEIAVAATPLLSKAMGVLSENMDEIANSVLPPLIKGFTWMVDNVDVIEAGLKGIGAALITKKAADGIIYAIEGYKTLTTVTKATTTATEAATAAQTALNVASKANVIGAIASVVLGLGTALYSYAKSSRDAAEETRRLNDETYILLESTKELHEEIDRNISDRKKSADAINNEYEASKKLADKLYELADKENKTSAEKAQMIALTEQLNKIMPELSLSIDDQTYAINKQESEVQRLIEAELQLQRVKLASENLAKIEYDKLKEEEAYNALLAEREEKTIRLNAATKALNDVMVIDARSKTVFDVQENEEDLEKEVNNLTKKIEESKAKIDELTADYKFNMDYIGDKSIVESSAEKMEAIIRQYADSMETNATDAVDTIDEAVEDINDIYKEASKELEKRIKKERKALEESHEDAVKEVEKASEKELKILEKAHKKKLELIDEEYLEKMKNTNEDRYNDLKKVQDQIDDINNQQEAEDRALQLREEAEKKAELQARIDSAKTAEERIEAQDELANYIEELSRDRLREERKLQTEILETEKDTINDVYDAKIQSLEDAQDEEERFADESYENEKKAIEERYKLKLEAIKAEQELEKENLEEKQVGYKTFLEDQKELAIQNAKDIYDDDLKQFKLNNALKYNEFETSEKEMMRYIKDNARSNLYSGIDVTNSQKILNSSSLSDMLKYYNQSSAVPSTPAVSFDYSEMGSVFKNAIKDLKLVFNEKAIATIVEDKVNSMIR